jgi:hypothetical protein
MEGLLTTRENIGPQFVDRCVLPRLPPPDLTVIFGHMRNFDPG